LKVPPEAIRRKFDLDAAADIKNQND